MYFQVSPIRTSKVTKCLNSQNEPDETPVLSLAPFTAIPKICFQDVSINNLHKTHLLIKNPKPAPVNINVFFDGPQELEFSLNWNECTIERENEVILELYWRPSDAYTGRHSLKIICQKRTWDIPVSFKSVIPQKKSKPRRKITTTLVKRKSPIHKLKTTKKQPLWNSSPYISPSSNQKKLNGKENINSVVDEYFIPSSNFSFNLIQPIENNRRDTYIINKENFDYSEPKTPDSLENSLEKPRLILKQKPSVNTPTLEELLDQKTDSFSFIRTPIGTECFKLKRNSTEIKQIEFEDNTHDDHFVRKLFKSSESSIKIDNTRNSIEKFMENISISVIKEEPNEEYECDSKKIENDVKTCRTFTFSTEENTIPDMHLNGNLITNSKKSDATFVKSNGCNGTFLIKGPSLIETKISTIYDPFILAATTSIDPFLSNTIHLEDGWFQQQEQRFKRWFNMLLTPPSELHVADDGQKIDAAKIWKECSKKEIAIAPTKEDISNKYHTFSKLDSLRNSARNFYMSLDIQEVLLKVTGAIESGKLEIRQDRNVHLDLSLQSNIMSLLLSYNPLWLRIGLETIYKEKLKLSSNSDIIGLSKFLYDRFFKDPQLFKRYKTVHCPKYTAGIKKLMLKRYLDLIFFLDKAKEKILIGHDPCLFRKNATVKESREMLVLFAKDAVTAGIGDITKYLKYFNYTVHHKQLYIHEFEYAVNNLGVDLRDGVRLTRVMEIILLRNDLTMQLRVPAISRLQKIHNVKLIFKSLEDSGYKIQHDIEPFHIVEGHREKTLSFLWQIIYKFQGPYIVKNVKTIQTWWKSLSISLKRNKLRKIYNFKTQSAIKIQKWYRRHLLSKKLLRFSLFLKEYKTGKKFQNAAVKIQSFFKMFIERRKYLRIKTSIITLQGYCKNWIKKRVWAVTILQKNVKMFLARIKYIKLKKSVIFTQEMYIAKKLMISEREHYLKLKSSVILIQNWFRATILTRKTRNDYLVLKSAVILVQQRFRSNQLTKKAVHDYQKIKFSTLIIQRWWSSTKKMKELNKKYLQLKKSVLVIEDYYSSYKKMKQARSEYLLLKQSTIVLQRRIRATFEMEKERKYFLSLKKAVGFVETKYKIKLLRKKSVKIIEDHYIAYRKMKELRFKYLHLKQSTILLQRQFRGYLQMKKDLNYFVSLKNAVKFIENRYKKKILMRNSVKIIEEHYLAYKEMKKNKSYFIQLKKVTILCQRQFRSLLEMKKCRENYTSLKKAAILIQEKYRANKLMLKTKKDFEVLKQTTIFIQRKYKAKKIGETQRKLYLEKKNAVLIIQKYFKNYLVVKKETKMNEAAVKIQRLFRGYQKMKIERNFFLSVKPSIVIIQKYVRGFLTRKKYAPLLTKEAREQRLLEKRQYEAATKIQAFWKGYSTRVKDKNQMKIIRQRCISAQNNAEPSNSLAARSEKAIELLVTENITLPLIISALTDFEYVTRRSPEICRNVGPILPEHLYLLIKSVARSLPEIKISVLSIYTLINLCKYPLTTEMAWHSESIDDMMNIMLHWCDKEEMVFPALCTLYWLFAHKEEYKSIILKTPSLYHKLGKMNTLVQRKQKMVMNSTKKAISSKFYPKKSILLPNLKPDWGIDYPNRPRIFTNSVHAIECLIQILKS